jgi:hypothetical protein
MSTVISTRTVELFTIYCDGDCGDSIGPCSSLGTAQIIAKLSGWTHEESPNGILFTSADYCEDCYLELTRERELEREAECPIP